MVYAIAIAALLALLSLALGAAVLRYRRREADCAAVKGDQARIRAIATSSQDGIVVIDDKGCILFWNPAAERILGYTAEEVLGQNLHSTMAPERFIEAHNKAFEKFLQTGTGDAIGMTLELQAIRKGGMEVDIELSLSAIKANGQWQALGIMRDITNRKLVQEELKSVLEHQQALFNNSTVGILGVTGNRFITEVNPLFCEMFGYEEGELVGMSTEMLHVSPKHYSDFGSEYYNRTKEDRHVTADYPFKRKDGTQFWASISGRALNPDDLNEGVLWTVKDITGRKVAEEMAAEARKKIQTILERSPFGVVVVGRDKRIRFANDYSARMAGVSTPEELIGQPCIEHLSTAGEDTCPVLDLGQSVDSSERILRTAEGKEYPILKSVLELELDGEMVLLESFIDISAQKKSEAALEELNQELQEVNAKLEVLAQTDRLTGFYNRQALNRDLKNRFENVDFKHTISFIMADLDHFKLVNDTYGHDAGDAVLTQFSNRVRTLLRRGDVVCRMGGEEFLLLAPEADQEMGPIIAERLRATIEKDPFDLPGGEKLTVTCSLGVCTAHGLKAGEPFDEHIKKADLALYRSKETGRNKVTAHEDC